MVDVWAKQRGLLSVPTDSTRPPDPAEPSIITQIFIDAYKSKNMKGIIGKLYEGPSE